MNAILVITQDPYLPKHLQPLGNVLCVPDMKEGISLVENETFDFVVVSRPFTKQMAQSISHSNVTYLENAADLKRFKIALSQEPKSQKTEQPKRRLRLTEPQIDYSEAKGHVLLVTTNRDLIRDFTVFTCGVSTNVYSARRYLAENHVDLVVWDIPQEPINLKATIYKWGEEVKTLKDIYLLLVTGKLSIEGGSS